MRDGRGAPSPCLAFEPRADGDVTMKWINALTLLLVIVGGINWGLVAVGGYGLDLVANLFGGVDSPLARIVYGVVGLSALYQLLPLARTLRTGETHAQAAHVRH